MTRSENDNEFLNQILLKLISSSKQKALNLIALIKQRSRNKGSIRIEELCKLLNISPDELSELLKHESDSYKITNSSQKIRADKLKFLVTKIEQLQSEILSQKIYDKKLCELIVNSDSLLEIIDSDVNYIRLSKLTTLLNLGIRHTCKLFEIESIKLKCDPNTKVSCDLLRHLLLNESKVSFSLSKLNSLIGEDSVIVSELDISNNEKLKNLYNKMQSIDNKPYTKSVVLNQFIRNEYIREYTKIRANGICELCDKLAPFIDVYGVPFLETHHVVFLSKGGDDTIDNVVALCPNCHRKIHNLNLESDVKKLLNKLEKHQSTNKITLNNRIQ